MTLAKSINFALADLMLRYPNVSLLARMWRARAAYGVTPGVQDKFGAARVFDTLLDEQTIWGWRSAWGITALSRSRNPVPRLSAQCEDQIRGEAATLSFFSTQQYRNPMVVRMARASLSTKRVLAGISTTTTVLRC